jgi:hypothetical protein|nr:MAG TPA: hypothetical protein [Caudoviricetes sp.]
MTIKEILYGGSGALVLIMSLLQVSKININPWTAIFGWFGKQLNHEVLKKVADLEKNMKTMQTDIDTIRDEGRERHAKDCRVRILRFADEIYLGTNHSQEHYKQVLGDITAYEKYCDDHAEFENQIAVSAIRQIKEAYDRHTRQHDFLQ